MASKYAPLISPCPWKQEELGCRDCPDAPYCIEYVQPAHRPQGEHTMSSIIMRAVTVAHDNTWATFKNWNDVQACG
jgi:hypothetical protein